MSGTGPVDPTPPVLSYPNAKAFEAPPPPARSPRRSPWAFAVLGVGAAALVLLALLLPPMGLPREGGQRLKCASNLRQLGLAMQHYANANGGAMPDRSELLVRDGLSIAQELFCPNKWDDDASGVAGRTPEQVASRLAAARVSYVFVGNGQSFRLSWGDVVIAYERPGHHPGPSRYKVTRPEDAAKGGHVLFADGSVSFVPEAVLAVMIQQLDAGQNPPPAATAYAKSLTGDTGPASR